MKHYSQACQYSTRLIEKLESLDLQNTLDFDLIDKAIYFAKKYHDGQYRKSGEPFYSHTLEVAYIVSDHLLHTNAIVASILHDIVEDTQVTTGIILDEFGWRIAEIVDRLTRDRPDGTKLSVEEILNNAHAKGDKEVLLIKCIDRLHNMKTLDSIPDSKRRKTAFETASVIIPFIEDINLEKTLNLLSIKIISPENTNYLNKLYSMKFSLDNYQLPSLIE